ncbi:glycosyltransferase [Candidatus Falkowbacteria bacterium]|nr:glycosyltransferase [Candidatus Falkowbacteria bacterium]
MITTQKIDVIMFNMSTFFDWDRGVVNRNYFILNELAKSDKINRLIGADFLPNTIRRAIPHYVKNIFFEPKTSEMVYGDLTSACYARTNKIYIYSTIDSVFSYKTVARELLRIERVLNLKNIVFWSYNPMFTEFIGKLNEKLFIFDTVDNWTEHAAYLKLMSKRKLIKNYQAIAEKADLIFTVSRELKDFYRELGRTRDVHWIPNGVDYAHFNEPEKIEKANPLAKISGPIIGYLGTIECRVDFDLIAKIASAHRDKTIALCGPVWPSIKHELKQKLSKYKNIILTGRVKYDDIPSYINRFDVAIIPHKINEFIKSTNPMKMYDYLACGKPIVTTRGAGVDMFADYVYATNDPNKFVKFIDDAINTDSAEKQNQRREIVRSHSWQARVNEMTRFVVEKLSMHRSNEYRKIEAKNQKEEKNLILNF